jgi:putative transposase
LQGYDYTHSGAYFVTICTAQRTHQFGEIIHSVMKLNALGQIAEQEFAQLSRRWQSVDVDLFVVMPNHVHAIIVLSPDEISTPNAQKPDAQKRVPTLGNVVNNYKGGVTRIARQHDLIDDSSRIWQGRYHDHIIREEHTLETVRLYIVENPQRWDADTFYS